MIFLYPSSFNIAKSRKKNAVTMGPMTKKKKRDLETLENNDADKKRDVGYVCITASYFMNVDYTLTVLYCLVKDDCKTFKLIPKDFNCYCRQYNPCLLLLWRLKHLRRT